MILILIFVLDLNNAIFIYPVEYRGDILQVLIYVKMIITGDLPFYTYAASEHIGLPYGFNSADFPSPMASNFLFLKILSFFSSDVFVVTNMYIITSYFMIINSMFFVLRRLRVYHYLAIAIAILLALVPYHHLRISHIWYVNYFLLPIGIYYLLLLWKAKPLFFIKRFNEEKYRFDLSSRNLGIIVMLVIFSLWNFYFTFFFVLLAGAVTISAWYYRRTRYHLFSGLLLIFFVTAPFVINLIPYKAYESVHGKNPQALKRYAHEAEVYGLKIAQMILPVDGHSNEMLRKIKGTYNRAPLVNENRTATLGMIGAFGFIIMTLFMLFHERVFSSIKKLSMMSYTAVMIATIGGYSSIFALLITPNIRGYNRISIYIATIALIAFALALTQLMRHYSLRKLSKVIISLVVLGIGIYDQVPSYMSYAGAIHTNHKSFLADKKFTHRVEEALSTSADKKVFQLPHMSSPESSTINGIGEYEQALGYLHSDEVKWSYGGVQGRESDTWIKQLTKLPTAEQVSILRSSGFSGIYIDRRGYKDRAKPLEQSLTKLLGIEPIVSANGSKSFFRMEPTGDKTYLFPATQEKLDKGSK